MGSPTPSTAPSTLRPDLGALMEFDLAADRQGFIGYRVAPPIEVGLQADNPGKIPLEQLLQAADVTRTASGGYRRTTLKFDKWAYATEEYGIESVVTERLKRMYQNIFDVESILAMRNRDIVLREAEKRIAALIQNTSTWTGSSLKTDVSVEWSTAATADPISDVNAAKQKVFDQTGLWPNALVICYPVFMNLRKCAKIIDRLESSGAGQSTKASEITAAMLAQVFDLDDVIVSGAAKNTADEGQTRVLAQIWDDEYAMVARIAKTNDVAEPCIARTFHWAEDGSQIGGAVDEYISDETRGKVIRCRHEVDEVVMYKECGHLLGNITA